MKSSTLRYKLMFGDSIWHYYTTLEEALLQRKEFLVEYKDDNTGLEFPIFKVVTTTVEKEIHV